MRGVKIQCFIVETFETILHYEGFQQAYQLFYCILDPLIENVNNTPLYSELDNPIPLDKK